MTFRRQPGNLNTDQIGKIVGYGANGIGAGNGNGLGCGDYQITGNGQAHFHMMKGHIGRNLATEIRGKAVCLVVGELCLDVKQPIVANKPIAIDAPVMNLLAL